MPIDSDQQAPSGGKHVAGLEKPAPVASTSTPTVDAASEKPSAPAESRRRAAAVFGARQGAGIYGERVGAGVAVNKGTIHTTVNMGNAAQAQAQKFSFQEDLRALSRVPEVPASLPFDTSLVDRYLAVARQGRVLVIEHSRGRRYDAETALNCVVAALHRDQSDKQLLTGVVERLFPLDEFCMTMSWSEHCRRSIIFLDRSDDGMAGEFFSRSSNRGLLQQQLANHDCYLVATVASPCANGTLASADHCWRLTDSEGPVGGESLRDCPDAFDALLLLCAIWFPGLAPSEFRSLVDGMQPPSPPSTPQAEPAPTNAAAAIAVAPPTRAQRWREGDRDRVLGELGISLFRADHLADAGYRLCDGLQGAGEWTLRQFPMLLLQQLDILCCHYFDASASTRYRSGLRDLLFAMDGAGVCQLEADWLVKRSFDALATGDCGAVADQLVELLVSGLSRSNGKRLAEEVAASLAQEVIDLDAGLQPGLSVDRLEAAWLALRSHLSESADGSLGEAGVDVAEPATDLEASNDFWFWILGSSVPGSSVVVALPRMLCVARVLLLLGEYLPEVALPQLLRLQTPGPLDAALWSVPQGFPVRIVRLHRLALVTQMFQIAKDNPRCWLVCAESVARAFGSAAGTPPAQHGLLAPSTKGALARRALAYDCLAVLAGLMDDPDGISRVPVWFESLFGLTQRPQLAQALTLLGPLLCLKGDAVQAGDSFDEDDLVWMFRVFAHAMLSRDSSDAVGVAARLTELAWPLRRHLNSAQRNCIVQRVRETQDLLNLRRDIFEDLGLLEELKQERQKLRAIQLVLRAFAGGAPDVAAGPGAIKGAKQ